MEWWFRNDLVNEITNFTRNIRRLINLGLKKIKNIKNE